jgi:uncharacterized membrane protein
VKRYQREGSGLSFERVAFFTDAVYAIALTLIVVTIGLPAAQDAASVSDLAAGLEDQLGEFVAFFVGVLVIGFYWSSHHESYDDLDAVDPAFVKLTVLYLALVAFLPYPIRLGGAFDQNPLPMIIFTCNVAAVSGMEGVLLWQAYRARLLKVQPSAAGIRWMLTMSLVPVPLFLVSIPVAFVNPWLAPLVWVLDLVLEPLVERRRPPDLAEH